MAARGAEAAALTPYIGRWIAQDGLEVLYEADSPYDVVRWLRKNGLRARVWRVPATPQEAGSMLSHPWSFRSSSCRRRREAEVGFCDPWPHGWGLLGQLSFFRYFVVTFRAVDFELEIEPVQR